MNGSIRKPKLIVFRSRYAEDVPAFQVIHRDEHVRCLSQFFDVTVIDQDCDYRQICDRHEPDLALFELGLQIRNARRPVITNTQAVAAVPKVAFLNADAWGETRAGILSDMDHYGIETAFGISVTTAEHMPAIAAHLFTWPNFIEEDTYRDYGASKLMPVVLTGCQDEQYPWRHKVYKILADSYPTLVCPHRGYRAALSAGQMMFGERYARVLNSAWFAPTCGTVAKEVVRKHFEIPGCKACLITEASPALTAAGFVDMQNCVFADQHDVLDKVAYLLAHEEVLSDITSAGYQLVHGRHTLRHRGQIFQWFRAFKSLTPNQRIIQTNPFDAPRAVESTSTAPVPYLVSNGLHLGLLRDGDAALWAGKYDEAERSYTKCLNYVGSMAEPKFRLSLCHLYRGNPKAALARIVPPIKETLGRYGAVDPDPVEWAYLIISLLCLGRLRAASKRASQFPSLHHPELDRARFAITLLSGARDIVQAPPLGTGRPRASLHHLPDRSVDEWIEQLAVMLTACGRSTVAHTLRARFRAVPITAEQQATKSGDGTGSSRPFAASGVLRLFDNPLLLSRLREKLGAGVLKYLHRLEAKHGYFLPYSLSAMRTDEFFETILRVTREEKIATALLIGARAGHGATEAFLAGIAENPNRPSVFCISPSSSPSPRASTELAHGGSIRWFTLPPSSEHALSRDIEDTLKAIIDAHHITAFDAAFIDGSAFQGRVAGRLLVRELRRAALLLFDDINDPDSFDTLSTFLRDSRYALVAHNPELRNGYAIFQRKRATAGISDDCARVLTEVCG